MSTPIHEQTFELLMKRFDTIEAQNKELLDLQRDHNQKDDVVHKVVERHSVYWMLTGTTLGGSIGILLAKLGLK